MALPDHPMRALKGTQQGRDLMASVRSHKTSSTGAKPVGDLSTSQRKELPSGDFAIPSKAPGSGSYPIPDLAHARNALSRVAANGTPAEQAQVRAAVHKKFPQLAPASKQPRGKKYDDIIAKLTANLPKG